MTNRVTQQTLQRSTLNNLQVNLGTMSRLQAQLSSGKTITKPSDDPGGTAEAMQLRAQMRANEQHGRNADNAEGWLSMVDSSLSTVMTSLRRARDLTVQGASTGVLSSTAREALAVEIESIKESLLAEANTTYMGRPVFAGTSDAGKAFDETTYEWTGTPSATVDRRIAPNTTVRVDGDGLALFGTGDTSLFAELDALVTDLRAGNSVSDHINTIDDRMTGLLSEVGGVGSRFSQVLTAKKTIETVKMDLSGQLAGVEDIDLAAVIVELQLQEVAYQAALGATQRVLQPTLLDFLR